MIPQHIFPWRRRWSVIALVVLAGASVARFSPALAYGSDNAVFDLEVNAARAGSALLSSSLADRYPAVPPVLRFAAVDPAMKRGKGIEKDGEILATGEEGTVIYGPHSELAPGDYTVRWRGHCMDSPGQLAFDVTARARADRLVLGPTFPAENVSNKPHSEIVRMDFSIPNGAPAVEARVFSRGGAKVALEDVVFERHGSAN